MVWNAIWPLGTVSVRANRITGAQNTAYNETTLKVDHYFNESALNDGKHKQVHLPQLVAAPSTAASEGCIFFIDALGRGVLRYRTPSNTDNIQMTGYPPTISATNGNTFLPGSNASGGIILQWGVKATPGSSGSVTFTTPFAVGTVPFCIQLTLERSSGNQSVTIDSGTIPTNAGFNYLVSSGGSDKLYWLAIGVKA